MKAKKPKGRAKRPGLQVRSVNGRKAKKKSVPKSKPTAKAEAETAQPEPPFDPPSPEELEAESQAPPEQGASPTCPNCDSVNIASRMETDEFAYGVAPSGVVLKAEVLVFECHDCKQRWTGEQAEKARELAVNAYLAGEGVFL